MSEYSESRKSPVPENIHSIIENDLVLLTNESDTHIYRVSSNPNLVIRHNRGGHSYDKLVKTSEVFNELPSYGINGLPYHVVNHDAQPYVITLHVEGQNLEEYLFEDTAPPRLIREIDTTWQNLTSYLMHPKQNNTPHAADIFSPRQYMFGTIQGDDSPHVWMVDLGEYIDEYSNPIFKTGDMRYYGYEGNILDILNSVLWMEHASLYTLVNSRKKLEQAIGTISDPKISKAAFEALYTSEPVDSWSLFRHP